MLVKILIVAGLFLFSNLIQAAPPVTGFETFDEFYIALEEMPVPEFEARGKVTSSEKLREWHGMLSKKDPKRFAKWNIKMTLLPSMGFTGDQQKGKWELKVPSDKIVRIGFQSQVDVAPTGFVSIIDFYKSLRQDTFEFFQARLELTDPVLFDRWQKVFAKMNPASLWLISIRATAKRGIGFQTDAEKRNAMTVPGEASEGPLGFQNKKKTIGTSKAVPIKNFKEFLTLLKADNYAEMSSRANVTQAKALQYWVGVLYKVHPKLYAEFLKFSTYRTEIGFQLKGEKPETIKTPPPPDEPIDEVNGVISKKIPDADCDELTL